MWYRQSSFALAQGRPAHNLNEAKWEVAHMDVTGKVPNEPVVAWIQVEESELTVTYHRNFN